MATEHQKNSAHLIIHSCAATSAAADCGVVNDSYHRFIFNNCGSEIRQYSLPSRRKGMVVSLGKLFGHSYEKGAAMAVVSQLIGFVFEC
ncbi:MAG: hypothetical protein U0401_08345 [Anaerolineae bacterium]